MVFITRGGRNEQQHIRFGNVCIVSTSWKGWKLFSIWLTLRSLRAARYNEQCERKIIVAKHGIPSLHDTHMCVAGRTLCECDVKFCHISMNDWNETYECVLCKLLGIIGSKTNICCTPSSRGFFSSSTAHIARCDEVNAFLFLTINSVWVFSFDISSVRISRSLLHTVKFQRENNPGNHRGNNKLLSSERSVLLESLVEKDLF